MYRVSREIELPIPGSSAEFCQMIPSSPFGVHYNGEVNVGNGIRVIFFSYKMTDTLLEVEDIYFDGTFNTVPCILSTVDSFGVLGPLTPCDLLFAYRQIGRNPYCCSSKNS